MASPAADLTKSLLLVVSVQPDFMPGGALPVPEGDAVVEPLRRLLEADLFPHYAAAQEWHPRGHLSFVSSNPGAAPNQVVERYGHPQTLWPDHCVQETPGAQLHPALSWRRIGAIFRLGNEPDIDSYSAFRNDWNAEGKRVGTGLAGYLRELGVTQLYLCGLARDGSVKRSALDGAAAGFQVHLLWDITRPRLPSADRQIREELTAAGVRILSSESLF